MLAALAGEKVLAADETPVNVLGKGAAPQPPAPGTEEQDPEERDKAAAGAPHVLIVRTPDGRLTWLQAIGSRRKGDVAGAIPAAFTGSLITDGYTGYQHLLERLAGIQQCCAHVIRRCRAVTKLGPGGLQSWAGDIITILRQAHQATAEAHARGDTALDPQMLASLRERSDTAAEFGPGALVFKVAGKVFAILEESARDHRWRSAEASQRGIAGPGGTSTRDPSRPGQP